MRKLIVFALLSVLAGTSNGYAKEDCLSISKKQVKVEAWVSKKYEKDYRAIRREFQDRLIFLPCRKSISGSGDWSLRPRIYGAALS